MTPWRSLLVLAAVLSPAAETVRADATLCATVKMAVEQALTLERQGFEARLRIANGFDHLPLEDIAVDLVFTDADGRAAGYATNTAPDEGVCFFVGPPTADGLSEEKSIAPSDSATLRWLIVPTARAGGTSPEGRAYDVGARLSYRIGAETNSMAVAPDTIVVRPLPALRLDYFLPGTVYGDDPLTADTVEPVVPFSLGLRVLNVGRGAAGTVCLDTGQPDIRRNDTGLPAAFAIESTEVNGVAGGNGLRAEFGDLPAGASGSVRWRMTCALYGTLTNFQAAISHADALGGRLTSLIAATNVHTHRLIRNVRVDAAGSDAVRDFLAAEGRLYESDGSESAVSNASGTAVLAPEAAGYRLDLGAAAPATGYVYVRIGNPEPDGRIVERVMRSDGKRLRAENVWLERVRNAAGDWEDWLGLFDADAGGCHYVLAYADAPPPNAPPVLAPIGDRRVCAGAAVTIRVTAEDETVVPALDAGPLPAGAAFADGGDGTGRFDWTPAAGQGGAYRIAFSAGDGELTARETVVLNVTEPAGQTGPRGLLMRVR
ncbi:MAG: hypothetical protein JW951_09125 [Lentisphaerae bacterium]|nr:hypothetical protein [Lentisphaerota bacterium]